MLPHPCMMRAVMGCPRAGALEHHSCPNHCTVFDYLATADYASHADDKCAICGEARFAKKKRGNRLKPRHRFWMMPLADAVRELLLSALEWLAGLEEGLVDPDPGVFRNSPEGKRLSAYAAAAAQARVGRSEGGDALDEVVTFWNLGADGFQPYE